MSARQWLAALEQGEVVVPHAVEADEGYPAARCLADAGELGAQNFEKRELLLDTGHVKAEMSHLQSCHGATVSLFRRGRNDNRNRPRPAKAG